MGSIADVPNLLAPVAFGHPMREKHFLFAPTYNPLNHGAYGTYPRFVQKRFHEVQALSEARPDAFRHHDIPEILDRSRAAIGTFLKVPVDEVVLISNASTGANVVLRSFKFEKGDVVVHLSTVYGAVRKTLEYLKEMTPMDHIAIEVEYPISDDELVEKFLAGIKSVKAAGNKVRLAVIDTVSSLPGVLQPWERLVAVCKEQGVLSFVDGAHSVGQIPLDLPKAKPDFFVSNLHKWLFVPRSCAVFHVPKRNQHLIRSALPTSYGFVPLPTAGKEVSNALPMGGKSRFVLLFELVATMDCSPFFCVEAALRFRREVCGGEKEIMEYSRRISNEAGKRAAESFDTEIMENAQRSLSSCAFCNVRLPIKMGTNPGEVNKDDAFEAVKWMANRLIDEHDTFAALYMHGDSFWVRFSGQIYLELANFERGIRALNMLCARVRSGDYRLDTPHHAMSALSVEPEE